MRLHHVLVTLTILATAATAACRSQPETAAPAPVTAPVYQTERGALDGNDPVAYFTSGAPAKGKPEFTLQWNGATWSFSSAEHLAAFRADPERYAPQYGGYCAYAVANGYTAKTEPDAWHIEDGRLYLNYNLAVRERWLGRKDEFIRAGTQNWPAVLAK